VCISHGTSATTSATTSTLSFGQTLEEEGEDVPFMDDMDMMTLMNTTSKPRVRSMFPEDEEDMMMMMMPMMPILLAPPCSLLSTSTDEVR